jgi:tetratricopeptide (TPR) repeat protein
VKVHDAIVNDQSRKVFDLLPMALARPQEALARARAIVADGPDPLVESVARHSAGIVLRDLGDLAEAQAELRAAVRLGRQAGNREREADSLTTLGTVLVRAGRTRAGMTTIDAAARMSEGTLLGMVLMRRGGVLHELGRHAEALTDLRRALAIFRQASDPVWEARTRTWLGTVLLATGETERADAQFAAAERLFSTEQELEVATAVQNRALVAFRLGDLPTALRHLDDASARYSALGVPRLGLILDRCMVLLAAGLPAEAFAAADGALTAPSTKRAELSLAAARAALAAGYLHIAAERGLAARRAFAAQGRGWWEAHARLLELQGRYALFLRTAILTRKGLQPSASLASEAPLVPSTASHARRPPRVSQVTAVARRLEEVRSDEAPQAWLLAGSLALASGATGDARGFLDHAALVRRRKAPGLTRVTGWHAAALRAEADGDSRGVFAACRRGFEVLDEHRLTLGAPELRARATAHGIGLASIALRAALRTGSPRMLLEWSERWRATELSAPAPKPLTDPELRSSLAALRAVTRRLDEVRDVAIPGLQVAPLESHLLRERTRLESSILARTRTGSPSSDRLPTRLEPVAAPLLRVLGTGRLVEIVQVNGALQVLICGDGRVRQFAAGDAALAAREVDFARFGLDRFAHGDLGEPVSDATAALQIAGNRLQELLLGEAADQLGEGPVVIVPPGRLHAVPWALLPVLRDRVFSVSPSARAWLGTTGQPSFGTKEVLVYGPELGSGRAEVTSLARLYGKAVVLGDGTATAERVLAAIDGSRLAHIAAHGIFRADSPLFSSLLLDDGPLTVYDVEGLRRAPYRLVLPACESGVQAPAGADELLGLAAALLPRGTAGIVASVVRVNDEAASHVMQALHASLLNGTSLAAALHYARGAMAGDPLALVAGWSFVALGAA